MASATLSLTRSYGSFFWGCAKFAVSPYTNTFMSIATDGKRGEVDLENLIAASVVCSILTFVVPVLPVITALTTAFSMIAMTLAALSMFLTYPLAVLEDTANSSWERDCGFSI